MKTLLNTMESSNNKTQLIVFGVLVVLTAIVLAYMNHIGAIHFDKY